MLMDHIILENFQQPNKDKEKEYIIILNMMYMLEIGKIILYKGMEYICFRMERNTKVMLKKELKLAKENIYTAITIGIKEIG